MLVLLQYILVQYSYNFSHQLNLSTGKMLDDTLPKISASGTNCGQCKCLVFFSGINNRQVKFIPEQNLGRAIWDCPGAFGISGRYMYIRDILICN